MSAVDRDAAGAELLQIITAAVAHHPRSQQRRIGPSELGIPCTWCLAHKLAGVEERRDGSGDWLPAIGTAVHAWLDEVFGRHDAAVYAALPLEVDLPEPRWMREERVDVGEVDGVTITGSADLYDTASRSVTDWKVVGKTTLRSAKANGPSETYRRQAHLYGRGFTRRGLEVDHVRIAYLPRDAVSLTDAVLWSEPYDEQVALATLARADALAQAVRIVGLPALLPTLQRDPSGKCFSCSRFPNADGSAPPKPGHARKASAIDPANPFAA